MKMIIPLYLGFLACIILLNSCQDDPIVPNDPSDPNVDTTIAPLPSTLTPDQPAQYEPINFGAFLKSELEAGYQKHKKPEQVIDVAEINQHCPWPGSVKSCATGDVIITFA